MVKLWGCTPPPKTNMDPKSCWFLNLGISFQPSGTGTSRRCSWRGPGKEKTDQTPIYWVTENEAFYLLHRYGYQPIHSWWFESPIWKKMLSQIGDHVIQNFLFGLRISHVFGEFPPFLVFVLEIWDCFDLKLDQFSPEKLPHKGWESRIFPSSKGTLASVKLPPSFGHPDSP